MQKSKKKEGIGEAAGEITSKKHLAQKAIEYLEDIRKSRGEHRNSLISKLEAEILLHLNPKTDEELFDEKIQDANAGFIRRIKKKMPALSASELLLCCYIRMDLDNVDIAAIKDISTRSVNMARHRLKKKMGLEKEQSLKEFIATY